MTDSIFSSLPIYPAQMAVPKNPDAELTDVRNALRIVQETSIAHAGKQNDRIRDLETVLTKFLLWGGADFEDDEKREYALTDILEDAYQLVPVSVTQASGGTVDG